MMIKQQHHWILDELVGHLEIWHIWCVLMLVPEIFKTAPYSTGGFLKSPGHELPVLGLDYGSSHKVGSGYLRRGSVNYHSLQSGSRAKILPPRFLIVPLTALCRWKNPSEGATHISPTASCTIRVPPYLSLATTTVRDTFALKWGPASAYLQYSSTRVIYLRPVLGTLKIRQPRTKLSG